MPTGCGPLPHWWKEAASKPGVVGLSKYGDSPHCDGLISYNMLSLYNYSLVWLQGYYWVGSTVSRKR